MRFAESKQCAAAESQPPATPLVTHHPKQRCSWTLDKPKTRCVVNDATNPETRLLLLREDLQGGVPGGERVLGGWGGVGEGGGSKERGRWRCDVEQQSRR